MAQASNNIRSEENYADQVTIYYLFVCIIYLLPTFIIIISYPAWCSNFKHKLGMVPKPKINHSIGGNVGILSKFVLNSKLCMSVQKFS